MSTQIELNQETCTDILRKYIDQGYRVTGSVSIKEGALIHKYFRVLKNQDKLPEDDKRSNVDLYRILFKVLDVFNANKAFSLDDAAVIDTVSTYLEDNVLNKTVQSPPKEPEPKIKEL